MVTYTTQMLPWLLIQHRCCHGYLYNTDVAMVTYTIIHTDIAMVAYTTIHTDVAMVTYTTIHTDVVMVNYATIHTDVAMVTYTTIHTDVAMVTYTTTHRCHGYLYNNTHMLPWLLTQHTDIILFIPHILLQSLHQPTRALDRTHS
jgi:hypothetical protein